MYYKPEHSKYWKKYITPSYHKNGKLNRVIVFNNSYKLNFDWGLDDENGYTFDYTIFKFYESGVLKSISTMCGGVNHSFGWKPSTIIYNEDGTIKEVRYRYKGRLINNEEFLWFRDNNVGIIDNKYLFMDCIFPNKEIEMEWRLKYYEP